MLIGGWTDDGGHFDSDVELYTSQADNTHCDPLHLQYGVMLHSSAATDIGIISCGGYNPHASSNCTLQTKQGEVLTFPSMIHKRLEFGMGIIEDNLYAIGGKDGTFKATATAEIIDIKNATEWKGEDLPFNIGAHCLTTTPNGFVLTGGRDQYENVRSKL